MRALFFYFWLGMSARSCKGARMISPKMAASHMNMSDVHERIELIRNEDSSRLNNLKYLETFILRLGMNDENRNEFPSSVLAHAGGLRIFQYPVQLAPYLQLLSGLNIRSYLEIGCRWGGNFIMTVEYLSRFHQLNESVAVDIHNSPVDDIYCKTTPGARFYQFDSRGSAFSGFMKDHQFDAIFIDGDHTYEGVRSDFLTVSGAARVYIFHDITSTPCPGVAKFWAELKATEEYEIHEFIEQYPEVVSKSRGAEYLGIGVAITRGFARKSPRRSLRRPLAGRTNS